MVSKYYLCTWNCNGIRNKSQELIHFLNEHKIDIMSLNETKLDSNDKFSMRGYHILRNDRNSNGGGVALLIRQGIPFVELPKIHCSIENVGILLDNKISLFSIYNPPSNYFNDGCINKLINNNDKSIIFGDFNARHTIWGDRSSNRNGNTLFKYLYDNPSCTLNFTEEHTYYPYNNSSSSKLDLVLSKNIPHLSKPINLAELSSDHNPIVFTLASNGMKNEKMTFDYSKTDWYKYRYIINKELEINNNITSIETLEQEILKFTDTLILGRNSTTKKIPSVPFHQKLPPEIIILIRTRNFYRKRWQKYRNWQDKTEMNKLTTEIRSQITTYRRETWNDKIQKLNTKDNSLWKMTKTLKTRQSIIPPLTHDTIRYTNDVEKTEILAKVFEESHNIVQSNEGQLEIENSVNEFLSHDHNENFETYITSPKELKDLIKKLPNNKSSGLDGVDNRLLKNLPKKATVQLMYIINAILMLSYWPNSWKKSLVIPIPKKGKNHSQPTSYRPISLLSTISKVAEKIVLNRLDKSLKKSNMRNPYQFGFKKKHNTVLQISRIVTDIITNFNKSKNTVMLLLDIEKAFDKVWLEGLLFKLIKLETPPPLIKLLHSYLNNRSFVVKVQNTLSQSKNVTAGVPQGSVLGPILFNIFIHDFPEYPNTKIALFADDAAIYTHSHYAQASNSLLRNHFLQIQKFYKKWKITLNVSKTEQIIFTRKFTNNKIFTPIRIGNHLITPKNSVRYLGVQLDSRLNFHEHIKNSVCKAYVSLKYLYPLLKRRSNLNNKNKKLLYTAMMRPIITYAAPVFSHLKNSPLKPLQIFQNKVLRLITNSNRYTRIKDLHKKTELETITKYIHRISNHFYEKQCQASDITQKITHLRINNIDSSFKHKLPYQNLAIFGRANVQP